MTKNDYNNRKNKVSELLKNGAKIYQNVTVGARSVKRFIRNGDEEIIVSARLHNELVRAQAIRMLPTGENGLLVWVSNA